MTSTAPPVLRITLRGALSTTGVDLAMTPETPVRQLLTADLLAELGLPTDGTFRVVTRTGEELSLDSPLGAAVEDGSLLFVLTSDVPTAGPSPAPADMVATPPRTARRGGPLAAAALCLLGSAGVVAGVGSAPAADAVRLCVGALLLLLAAAALLAPRGSWGDACRLLAPGSAALGAGVVLLGPDRPGQGLLAVTAAAVAAGLAAAVLLAGRQGATEGLRVWLTAGGLVAVASGGGLVVGAPVRAVAALLAALAVCALPMLPALSIDVPDAALLDADDSSGPAWQSTGGGRSGRRMRVRHEEVSAQVAAGRRLLEAAVLAAVLVAVAALPVVLMPEQALLPRIAALVLAGCVAGALPLHARASRGSADRTVLLTGGVVVGGLLALALAHETATRGHGILAAATGFVAIATTLAAIALGRGWRSVRWTRFGDIVQTLSTVLALPAALVASNTVEHVVGLVS